MSLRCYIIDDEFHAIEILRRYVEQTPGLTLGGCFNDPLAALEEVAGAGPALIFLDVDMPTINGLTFAGMIGPGHTVIFTTSYREYALDAFEKNAADYLLKPISYERFLQCIQKIRGNMGGKTMPAMSTPTALFIKTGIKGKLTRLNISDIRYISAALNYIEIHLKEHKLITYLSLCEALEKLPAESFSMIHRSYIVHHDFIRSVEYAQLKLQDETMLPIGRAYRAAFRQKLNSEVLISKRDLSE